MLKSNSAPSAPPFVIVVNLSMFIYCRTELWYGILSATAKLCVLSPQSLYLSRVWLNTHCTISLLRYNFLCCTQTSVCFSTGTFCLQTAQKLLLLLVMCHPKLLLLLVMCHPKLLLLLVMCHPKLLLALLIDIKPNQYHLVLCGCWTGCWTGLDFCLVC